MERWSTAERSHGGAGRSTGRVGVWASETGGGVEGNSDHCDAGGCQSSDIGSSHCIDGGLRASRGLPDDSGGGGRRGWEGGHL